MGFMIEDGQGGGLLAGVTTRNRFRVDSLSAIRGFYVSRDDGRMFNTISIISSAAAGNMVLYFKNDSTTLDYYVDILRVGAVEMVLWKVHEVTGTAAGGSALTPVNLNLKSGVAASATVRGDGSITGLTSSNVIAAKRTSANSDGDIPFDDVLILGTNNAIAVEYDTGTTGIAEVLMRGFFGDPEE